MFTHQNISQLIACHSKKIFLLDFLLEKVFALISVFDFDRRVCFTFIPRGWVEKLVNISVSVDARMLILDMNTAG